MTEIRQILCPVDFSEVSRHALDHAIAIARWYNSRVTALHVVADTFVVPPPFLFAEFDTAQAFERTELAHVHLKTWVMPADRESVYVDAVVEHGEPSGTILRHAASGEFDLVVMGTHGHSGFERLVLGSVAEKVLRKATRPVLTVPPRAETSARLPYRRLLCPVDFSPTAAEALRFAVSIAQESDGELTILNVVDMPDEDALQFARSEGLEFRRQLEMHAYRELDALVTGDMRDRCRPQTRLAVGRPYREILAVAAQEQIDLIVMGVRGRNPVDLAFFGSTTNHIVRSARCPVLTVRT